MNYLPLPKRSEQEVLTWDDNGDDIVEMWFDVHEYRKRRKVLLNSALGIRQPMSNFDSEEVTELDPTNLSEAFEVLKKTMNDLNDSIGAKGMFDDFFTFR